MPTSILTHGRVAWTNILHPTQEDIDALAQHYPQFHPLNLNDCLTPEEFPKLDHHDDYVFLVIHVPYWDQTEHISRPAEVDIFITQGVLVTSQRGEVAEFAAFFERAQSDETFRAEVMGHGASPLLYQVLSTLLDAHCLPIARKVEQNLQRIENSLFSQDTRQVLADVALVRRDIIALRHILRPQTEVLQALSHGNWSFIHNDLDLYWDDLSDTLAQLRSRFDEHAEVVAGLSDTIDTLASHRIDAVMRLLTIVTVLTLPVTLLATVFGMNILMPFADHPLLFFAVVGLGMAFTAWLVWFLRKRNWL